MQVSLPQPPFPPHTCTHKPIRTFVKNGLKNSDVMLGQCEPCYIKITFMFLKQTRTIYLKKQRTQQKYNIVANLRQSERHYLQIS